MRVSVTWGLAIVVGHFLAPAVNAQQPGEKVWLKDYEEAKAAAKKAGKPIFAVLR